MNSCVLIWAFCCFMSSSTVKLPPAAFECSDRMLESFLGKFHSRVLGPPRRYPAHKIQKKLSMPPWGYNFPRQNFPLTQTQTHSKQQQHEQRARVLTITQTRPGKPKLAPSWPTCALQRGRDGACSHASARGRTEAALLDHPWLSSLPCRSIARSAPLKAAA